MSFKVVVTRYLVAFAMAGGALLMFLNALGADIFPETSILKSFLLFLALVFCSAFMIYTIYRDIRVHKEMEKGGGSDEG